MAFIQRLFTAKMCFVAGTPVMTQGGLKPIEAIMPGEVVWSRNEMTHAEGWQPVVDTFTTHPETLHTLRLDADGDGAADEETLTCTGEHPFWVVEQNAFVPAAELRRGWHLLRAHGSGQVTVVGVETTRAPPGQPFTTYNFEVATDHTYFVGESGVWVHNEGKDCAKIFSMFHRSARSLGGVDNLKARRFDVLADVRRQSRLSGEKIAHASWQESAHEVSDKVLADFASGGFDRIDDFPTVARWDAEFYLRPQKKDARHLIVASAHFHPPSAVMKAAPPLENQPLPLEEQLVGVNAKTGLYPGARSWSGGRRRILGKGPLESYCYHVMSRTCGGDVFSVTCSLTRWRRKLCGACSGAWRSSAASRS